MYRVIDIWSYIVFSLLGSKNELDLLFCLIISDDMMSLSRSVPVTVGVGFIAVTISATWIRKRQGTSELRINFIICLRLNTYRL